MRDRRHDVDSLPRVGAYVTVVLIAPRASPDMLRVVAILPLGTAVYGAALALVQTSARRACGYLFLSQSALVMAWLDCTSVSALAGGLLLWLSAGIAFAGLARCVLVLEARRGRLDDEGAHLGIVVRPENAKHPSLFNNSPRTRRHASVWFPLLLLGGSDGGVSALSTLAPSPYPAGHGNDGYAQCASP
jgi:hypothetical protein